MTKHYVMMTAMAITALSFSACSQSAPLSSEETLAQSRGPDFEIVIGQAAESGSYLHGRRALKSRLALSPNTNQARNVILFIGDGMGVSTLTAGRIYSGQKAGGAGENHVQAMESFPYSALVKTYNTNQQVSDSAGTATAIMTGVKTRAGVINIAPHIDRKDCAASLEAGLPNLAQMAARAGYSTGVVSTARLTHATPAAVYARSPERGWEAPKDVSAQDRAAGCLSIAEQLIAAPVRGHMAVALGGGLDEFKYGDVDLTRDWDGPVVTSMRDMFAVPDAVDKPVLGLFSGSHMEFARMAEAGSTEPSLAQMTQKAISILEAKDTGYFLMVEAGRIDHGHHAGIAELALEENRQFDQAIKRVLDTVDLSQTLIIVTADHSHVLTMGGYPARGNPILGAVRGNDSAGNPDGDLDLAADGKPYTTLGYHNGPGAVKGVRNPDGLNEIYYQTAAIPTGTPDKGGQEAQLSETHAGEDVPAFAIGPQSHLLGGVIEQNVLFHIMHHALGLPDAGEQD